MKPLTNAQRRGIREGMGTHGFAEARTEKGVDMTFLDLCAGVAIRAAHYGAAVEERG